MDTTKKKESNKYMMDGFPGHTDHVLVHPLIVFKLIRCNSKSYLIKIGRKIGIICLESLFCQELPI